MSRFLLLFVCIALMQSCGSIPEFPRSERVLMEETETTIPAGTPFTTPSGAVGVTTEPIEVTIPAGTKIEGTDYRAAVFGAIIGAAIIAIIAAVLMPKKK